MAAAVPSVILNGPRFRQPPFAPTFGQRRQQLTRQVIRRRGEQQTGGTPRQQRRMRTYAVASEALTAPPAPPIRKATGTVFVSGRDSVGHDTQSSYDGYAAWPVVGALWLRKANIVVWPIHVGELAYSLRQRPCRA